MYVSLCICPINMFLDSVEFELILNLKIKAYFNIVKYIVAFTFLCGVFHDWDISVYRINSLKIWMKFQISNFQIDFSCWWLIKGISCEITLRWMSLDLSDDNLTLVQVMAWCRQATSHHLSQGWPRSMLPYGITRPQWVKEHLFYTK